MAEKNVVELIESRGKFEVAMKPPHAAIAEFPGESDEADMKRVLGICDKAESLNVPIFVRVAGGAW